MLAKKHNVIVGCGNIGSRHLQGIAKLPYDLTIEVVEKIKKAQEIAKSRLAEVNYDKNKLECFWYDDISQLKDKADLVIVSTQAPGKVNLICKLLDLGYKRS